MEEIDEALKFVENNSLSSDTTYDVSDKAPLAQLNEVSSNVSDLENLYQSNGCEVANRLTY